MAPWVDRSLWHSGQWPTLTYGRMAGHAQAHDVANGVLVSSCRLSVGDVTDDRVMRGFSNI